MKYKVNLFISLYLLTTFVNGFYGENEILFAFFYEIIDSYGGETNEI